MSGQRSRQGTRSAGLKAGAGLARKSEMSRGRPLARTGQIRRKSVLELDSQRSDLRVDGTAQPGQTPRKSRRETGFSGPVKLAVRKRAGNGDIEQASCEACDRWLGRHGGEVQHIQARGSGGSKLRNVITNAVLLCGPSADKGTCHGRCEARDERMRAMGFWLRQSDEPQPVMLHGEQGGALLYLTDDGRYSAEAPEAAA